MTQGLNQIGNLGTRCSQRKTRPRMDRIPRYIELRNEWKTISYSFTDSNGVSQSGEMCDTMVVLLLPRAFEAPGSTPGDDELEPITKFLIAQYPQHYFIKGHMWNQEVGGKGETYNLVPLTSRANSAHKNSTETPLKEALRSFDSYYEFNRQISKVYGFVYHVEIQDQVWPGVTEGIVPNAIYVQASPIEYDATSGNYTSNNSIIQIVPTGNNVRGKIQDLSNGIWIEQNGQVTPA